MSELRELGSESLARKVSELREVKRVEGSGLIAGHESSVKKGKSGSVLLCYIGGGHPLIKT